MYVYNFLVAQSIIFGGLQTCQQTFAILLQFFISFKSKICHDFHQIQ